MSKLLSSDPDILFTPHGFVDLTTGEWSDAVDRRGFYHAGADPDDDANCPRWLAFLEEITEGSPDKLQQIARFMGYSLGGHTNEHCALMLRSPEACGKSVLLNAWSYVLGGFASSTSVTALKSPAVSRGLAYFKHIRLLTCHNGDLPAGWSDKTLAALTDGAEIQVDRPFDDFASYVPDFKFVSAHLRLPKLRSDTDDARQRIRVVPLGDEPQNTDPDLAFKLYGEVSGILRWMIQQHLDWRKYGLDGPTSDTILQNLAAA